MGTAIDIVVHDQAQMRAARAARAAAKDSGRRLRLRTAPGAAAYAGVDYLRAAARAAGLDRDGNIDIVIDCGADGALAVAAINSGWRKIGFSGPAMVAAKLADIAAQAGAELVRLDQPPALDLGRDADPERRLKALLAKA